MDEKKLSQASEPVKLLASEQNEDFFVAAVEERLPSGESAVHVLVSKLGPHYSLDLQRVVDVPIPVIHLSSGKYSKQRSLYLSKAEETEADREHKASNGQVDIRSFVDAAIVVAKQLVEVDPTIGQLGVRIEPRLVKERLTQGIAKAFGVWHYETISPYKGPKPLPPRNTRLRLYTSLHVLFILTGVENNVKVYKDAFGYARPTANQDVAIWRKYEERRKEGE